MQIRYFEKIIMLLTVLFLSSCGGSGGDGSSGSGDEENSKSGYSSYLFYTGSIHAVDPTNPTNPITIEAGSDIVDFSAKNIFAATYSNASKTLSNFHTQAVIYAKTNGKLYKNSALLSDSSPTPTQLSNEAAADKMCTVSKNVADYANPNNSQYVYRIPGFDATCYTSDDAYKMVTLGMSATSTPVTAKKPIASFYDTTTFSIKSWLVNDSGALKLCDANFKDCGASLMQITSYAMDQGVIGAGYSNRELLEIDKNLYIYDAGKNSLSYIFGDSALDIKAISDQSRVYFYNNGTFNSIYSAPIDGSAMATQLITIEPKKITKILLTTSKVIYTTGTELKATPKDAGPGSESSLVSTLSDEVQLVWTYNSHIYYSIIGNANGPVAGSIDDDGSNKVQTAGALWVGTALNHSINVNNSIFFQTILRAEASINPGSGFSFGGGTLRSFDMGSGTEIAQLGKIPPDINLLTCPSGLSNGLLCWGTDSTFQSDVFFIDTEAPNSMVRVTNTPTQAEMPIN